MNPKIWPLIGFAIVLAFLLLFLRHQKQSNVSPNPIVQHSQATLTSSSVLVISQKTNNLPQTNTSSSSNQLSSINDRQKANEIRQYMESQNKPVEFYGQVVDQDGSPLAGVNVKGEILHVRVVVPTAWGDEDEIIPITKETDPTGRFEIQGVSGRAIELESIQKIGYDSEPVKRAWGTSEGRLEKPVIFKMWSTNIHEKLIIGEKPFDVIPDGRTYYINLTYDTISETVNNSDLKVWIRYTNQVTRSQLYDWSAGIEVINGGLQASDSYSMFFAPTDGYVQFFNSQQQIKGGQRGEIGERRFYLVLKNGREYGRMAINLIAPFNDQTPGVIRLSYAINPTGSRILR
jgi:hypothetical protein